MIPRFGERLLLMIKVTDLVRPASKRDAHRLGRKFSGKTSDVRIFRVTGIVRNGRRVRLRVTPVHGRQASVATKLKRWVLA